MGKIYQTSRHIPENNILHSHCNGKMRPQVTSFSQLCEISLLDLLVNEL
jgi:hypothetical protein